MVKIVSHRGPTSDREYLFRWRHFAKSDDSWVPAKGINSLECIVEYWDSLRKAQRAQGAQRVIDAQPATRAKRGSMLQEQAAVPRQAKRGRLH